MSDSRSDEARQWRRLYKTAAWQQARQAQLAREPLCERCKSEGRLVPATVVNHRRPHKGDTTLFFDPANHESVCKPHHDSAIQSEERLGYAKGCDVTGRPRDAGHPWNK
jgi:5-methylcytosine-specific restriction endonuclease McrA